MDRSIDSDRRTRVVGPKRGPDLVDILRELGIVFRAESGIACRVTPDVEHAFCDTALGNTINRSVSVLLQQVSQRGRATLVALSIATAADGSILIRIDVDEPKDAAVEELPPAVRARLSRLRGRLVEFDVRLETHDDSPSALLVVPGPRVSLG